MYWTAYDADLIESASLNGTDRQTLLSLPTRAEPLALAVDAQGAKIYWSQANNSQTGTIWTANLDGTNPHQLVDGLNYPATLQLDLAAGEMYWADTHGTIERATLAGDDVQVLESGLNVPEGLALDLVAGKMYWTDYYGGGIYQANLDGSDVQHRFDGTDNGDLGSISIPEPASISLPLLLAGVF
jgi:hypothetical protein